MPTTRHPLHWIDAFTDTPFGGNPCAVVFDADDVDEATRIAFTRETRLSECAFLQHTERADVGVRYYVASGEIPMAGHPTIATVTALVDAGRVPLVDGRARFTLEVGAGVLPIEVDATRDGPPVVTMTQLRPTFGREWDAELVAPLVGLDPADLRATPRTVSTGTAFLITPVTSHDALRRAVLDVDALHALHDQHDTDFFEPFLTAMGGATDDGDVFSRLLLTPPEPPEDPFTGSATGCLGAWLWATGELPTPTFVAEQGHDMGRPGRAGVEVVGSRDDISGVRVSGRGVVLLRGHVDLPAPVGPGDPPPDDGPGTGPGGGSGAAPDAPIVGLATGAVAFIGETEKNLDVGTTTLVTSHLEFLRTFGTDAGELATAVEDCFRNGGRRVVIAPALATVTDHRAARAALVPSDADLLVLPPGTRGGSVAPALVSEAVAWAEANDRFVLLDPTLPDRPWDSVPAPPVHSSHAAQFVPRILRVGDDRGPHAVAGAVAGLVARTDAQRGVWQAPAGRQATVRGVAGPADPWSADTDDRQGHLGVSPLRWFPGPSVVVWGARTTAPDDAEYRYVSVRRTASWVRRSLVTSLAGRRVDPADDADLAAVESAVGDFLLALFRDGGVVGTDPDEAFFVRCDRTTTTPADAAAGRLRAVVGIAPLRPADFVVLRVEVAVA